MRFEMQSVELQKLAEMESSSFLPAKKDLNKYKEDRTSRIMQKMRCEVRSPHRTDGEFCSIYATACCLLCHDKYMGVGCTVNRVASRGTITVP